MDKHVKKAKDECLEVLRHAVHEACTCGGGGPDMCCPACEVWHRYHGLEITTKHNTNHEDFFSDITEALNMPAYSSHQDIVEAIQKLKGKTS